MPFVFWNVSSVSVSSFFIKQSPLWALNIMNGTDLTFRDITANSTATNVPYGVNWVQNTDGFDTMDARNVLLDGFTYQGGDDCIAIKPRPYGITIKNVTCHGGNGIAIGSLGQYLEDSSVRDILIKDVNIIRYNEDMHNSAYIKTWVGVLVNQTGYESDYQPRGGGWGNVTRLRFENFHLEGANAGPNINQDSGNNGRFYGTSLMTVSDVEFVNFTGYIDGTNLAGISCSMLHPCSDIKFEGFNLTANSTSKGTETCKYIAPGGVTGLNGTTCV